MDDYLEALRNKGMLTSDEVKLTPLTGGVSSEIYRVDNGVRTFVMKRALEKLNVEADWYADTSRNATEQAFIRYVGDFRPDAVPKLLHATPGDGFFCMEFLEGYSNWKTDLLSGVCSISLACEAGNLVGEIHARSWGEVEVAAAFDKMESFEQLRIDPYLRATAAKHLDLRNCILDEADRLAQCRECLIHGDYSPKNFLHREGRLVLLDCEVACFGEAAFDLAFLLNHFLLKSLYHVPNIDGFAEMVEGTRRGYRVANPTHAHAVETRTAHLLPMLLLARVDGVSPVEYLSEGKQEFVRDFAHTWIGDHGAGLTKLCQDWFAALKGLSC